MNLLSKKRTPKKPGFTLLEIILALLILSIIIFSLSSANHFFLSNIKNTKATVARNEEMTMALEYIVSAIEKSYQYDEKTVSKGPSGKKLVFSKRLNSKANRYYYFDLKDGVLSYVSTGHCNYSFEHIHADLFDGRNTIIDQIKLFSLKKHEGVFEIRLTDVNGFTVTDSVAILQSEGSR
ncbi:MAG: prepilin-type N-terminal cleavage/methylation domain-containing protein [Tissierellia bacterium]|nr:prepilin-type N-terminal cleavage/methylation domain-containing protein [Tissierellia bacterium]